MVFLASKQNQTNQSHNYFIVDVIIMIITFLPVHITKVVYFYLSEFS